MQVSQKSLLHRRLQCFVDFIAPEKDEQPKIKELFQQIAARIRKHATEEGYTIASVHYAGSYAKRTGLRRHMTGGSEVEGQDVDIAVILEDRNGRRQAIQHSLVPVFKRYLLHQWEPNLVDHTKSSATLHIRKHQLRFDVVPLIKTEEPNIQKLIRTNRELRTTSVQGHTEFVRKLNRSQNNIHFNNGLRLVKWWRYHQQITSGTFSNQGGQSKVPSFLLDLLCASAHLQAPNNQSYPELLYKWFRHLTRMAQQRVPIHFGNMGQAALNHATEWCVIDPMDATNNVVAKWAPHKVKELASWLQRSRDLMAQAIHYDSDGQHDASMQCLKALFGPSIKTQCKHLS